ncbi:CDP-diacylglycerol--glycerol-3-phosphate 3-phosphatidyltransferase [Glaesserella parasuis ZJ0906]|uniref:CDP-diacylglycerol--glycerol-3-phosphate 3-phosphatidyltransferase n=1 Tax=Glaesserella parasuis ZJ0906 TaxID=1322346 RepID=A0A806J1M7_GLAPU|nr:CDP-diacylglycerol--glycerol-3-phosphate 3-phosphatidyltransferase [Glaesserella parasuis ZJ0906]
MALIPLFIVSFYLPIQYSAEITTLIFLLLQLLTGLTAIWLASGTKLLA